MTISPIRGNLSENLLQSYSSKGIRARTQADSLKDSLNINRQAVSERNAERTPEAQPERPTRTYDEGARLRERPDVERADRSRRREIEPSRRGSSTDSDVSDELRGVFKGNALIFEDRGAALIFGDDGEVTVVLNGEDGRVITGKGTIDGDGNLSVTLGSGKKLSASLTREGDVGILSNITIGDNEPRFVGRTDGKNAAFDGFYLENVGDGQFNVTINAPDGSVIKGTLVQDENGDFIAKLDNGQSYKGNLSFEGDKAFISDVERIDDTPTASPEREISDVPQAPKRNTDLLLQDAEVVRPVLDLEA